MLEITWSIQSAMSSISASFMPRVVMAGVPRRMPDGSIGERGSKGTVFLLRVMPTSSRVSWAFLPVTPLLVRSTSIKWLSVPPEIISKPRSISFAARCWAFLITWRA